MSTTASHQQILSLALSRSWARRTASGVRVVLAFDAADSLARNLASTRAGQESTTALGDGELATFGTLRLSRGAESVDAPLSADPAAGGYVVEIPGDGLVGKRPWALTLLDTDGAETALEARLLIPRRNPVALLPGPAPLTRMRAPARRQAPSIAHASNPDTPRRRARRAAARVVDTVLGVLPDKQASATRERLARVGRRVLR